GDSRPVSAEEIGEAMAEIKGDNEPVEPGQVQKLLRQAHDRELIDIAKEDNGEYTVKLREATPTPKPEPVGVTDADEANDPPMPESSAPPSMRAPPQAPPAGGIPSRSERFRRGSRGPRVGPPEVPKIGVVEIDPNFKPRIELLPPKPTAPPPPAPVGSEPPSMGAPVEREQRGSGGGGGGRGGRGRRGGGRDEREPTLGDRADRGERGERSEQSGRGRRGGRGRGGRGRGGSRSGGAGAGGGGVSNGERGDPRDTFEPRMAP